MKKFIIFILLSITIKVGATTYYVAPTGGSDSNAGTNIAAPWATWKKAFLTAQAGDTVYFRDGVWYPSVATDAVAVNPREGQGHNGAPGNPICYFNYPGETPILDFRNVVAPPPPENGDGNRYVTAMLFYDTHWLNLKGLTIRNVYQREEYVRARGIVGWPTSNMTFENMTVHNIGGEGYYFESDVGYFNEEYIYGWDDSGIVPYDTTRYINCDTYQCCDTLPATIGNNSGNMGDGFKHINIGGYVTYENCRVWYCADDGFDTPGEGVINFNSCWSFANGLTNGMPDPEYEGNGFKTGGAYIEPTKPTRTLVNCLSSYNKGQGIYILEFDGLTKVMARIYNCTIYKNGIGITISHNASYEDSETIIRNTIVYGSTDRDAISRPYELDVLSLYTESNNNFDYYGDWSIGRWVYAGDVTVTDDDFVTTSYQSAISQLTSARQGDFSLPDFTFLTLSPSSDLIDAGIDVGLAYTGDAPDLGYAEYDGIIDSTLTDIITFVLPEETGNATINATTHTVSIEVAFAADVTDLTPTIGLSYGATVLPLSGVSQDFTSPVVYTVTALDETTEQTWTVTVTQEEEPIIPSGVSLIKNGTKWIFNNGNWVRR